MEIYGNIGIVTDQAEIFGLAITSPEGASDDQWMRDLADWLQDHIPNGVPWTGNVTDVQIGAYTEHEITPNP